MKLYDTILERDRPIRCTVGSRRLWTHRRTGEIRTATEGGDDPTASAFAIEEVDGIPEGFSRFAVPDRDVRLTARCADRPMVVRPAIPLSITPGASATIYTTTPVWLGLKVDGDAEPFFEVPVLVPRPTWFGATPQAGELAYATRTRARTAPDPPELLPGRALTRLTLHNPTAHTWAITRLKVPTPFLPLLAGERGLWTPSITVRNSGEGEIDMQIAPTAPPEAGPVQPISPARKAGVPKLVLRALGAMGILG